MTGGSCVDVTDSSAVASARRMAAEAAESMQLSAAAAGRAALAATELATNLVKHAKSGSIIFAWQPDRPRTITMIAIDKAGGIANLGAAMRDGFSTAGSPGTGLGAASRAASVFDVYSIAGQGTAVMCEISDEASPWSPVNTPSNTIVVGGVCLAKSGEETPGDSWIVTREGDSVTVAVIDGLGHGPAAATAALAGVRVVREYAGRSIEEIIQAMHGALRPTRGAAVGIARIQPARKKLDFVGVGNIGAFVSASEAMRRAVSMNGIVGHEMRKVQTFSYPWSAESQLVMYSDGIGSSVSADGYPGLTARHPSLISAVLYRDFRRRTDDATVVVAKHSS